MKKFITLFLAASALAITTVSCSKDNNASSSSAVSGKWYYNTTLTTHAGVANGQEMPYNYSQCTGQKSYLDFQAGSALDEGDIFQDCTLHNYKDTWTQTGDALHTVLDTGAITDYTVVSVTSTTLVLKNYPDSTDKTTFTVYNFTRQ